MPTYDYECNACGHAFERFQEISARKLRTCPECGKRALQRLIGRGMGVIFKGSGFYETDYKRAAAKSGGKATDAGASTPEKSSPPSSPSGGKPGAAKSPSTATT